MTSVIVWAAIALFSTALSAPAPEVARDHERKAAYLLKFVPFVAWPDSAFANPGSPFVICIVNDSTLAGTLEPAVADQREQGHPIAIRAVNAADPECQVLYIPGTDGPADAQAIATVKGRPVLTVTDLPADAAGHGMIGFIVEGDHVRFDIDNAAATDCGLAISSKLLGLARVVRSRTPP